MDGVEGDIIKDVKQNQLNGKKDEKSSGMFITCLNCSSVTSPKREEEYFLRRKLLFDIIILNLSSTS